MAMPRRAESTGASWDRLAAGFALAVGLAGCCGVPPRAAVSAPDPEERRVAADRIAEASGRIAAMQRFESAGVAILRLPDAAGVPQREQLDLLWLAERPLRTALRLKLGVTDTLAWFGSDGSSWWAIFPQQQPSTAYTGAVDASERGGSDAAGDAALMPLLASPQLLRILAGLELPPPGGEPAWDQPRSAWRLEETIASPGGPLRVARWFDRGRCDLEAVEIRGAGGPLLRSGLSEHAAVEVPGRSEGDWPRIATHLDLSAEGLDGKMVTVQLRLDRPSGLGRRVKPQLFEFSRLLQAMPVEKIVEATP